jgi:hypothetical protein
MRVLFVPLLIVAVDPQILLVFLPTCGPSAIGVHPFPPIPFFVAIFIAIGFALAPSSIVSDGVMGSSGLFTVHGGNRYLVHLSGFAVFGPLGPAAMGENRVLSHLRCVFSVGKLKISDLTGASPSFACLPASAMEGASLS